MDTRRVAIAILAAAAVAAGLGGKPDAARSASESPRGAVTERVEGISVGAAQSYGGLTILPLTARSIGGLEYFTLDEAMREKAVEVVEKDGGTVNTDTIHNRSGRPIFIMDGEEIIGAKQNRVLNTSVLIGAERTAQLPVSCVEQGRWTGASMSFRSGGTQLFAKARQANVPTVSGNYALKPSAGARSDQSHIWAQVAEKRATLSMGDASGPMHEAYTKYGGKIDDYVKHFHTVPGQVGAVFAIRGEIIGADMFDQSETLTRLFAKMVKSYALDAIERPHVSSAVREPRAPGVDEARRFVRLVLEKGVSVKDYPSAGEGRDVRISSRQINGSGLVAVGRPVHIALFAPERPEPIPLREGGLRPPSQRR